MNGQPFGIIPRNKFQINHFLKSNNRFSSFGISEKERIEKSGSERGGGGDELKCPPNWLQK